MTDLRRFALALPLLALAPAAGAAPPGFEDPQFNKAAVLVLLYDRLDAECARQRRLDAGERARLDAWQARNRLAAVRRRVAELGADPRTRATHQALRRTVENQDGGLGADRCAAMLALVKLPDAQLADTLPGMLARLEAPDRAPASTGSSAGAAAAPTEASTDSRPVARSRSTAELAREIDSFGFDARAAMGIGGFLTTRIFPIVLFRDGRALLDVAALAQPEGIEAHRRAHPEDWTRWRREGGVLQLERRDRDGDGARWEKPSFQTTWARLPDGFRLEGRFRSLTGTGNLAVGGADSVVAWREYGFARDGRVQRGGGAGASAGFGDASVATSGVAPGQRGRYRIDGLLLRIDWDDGSHESRLIVADPADPRTAIWLDGDGYVQR